MMLKDSPVVLSLYPTSNSASACTFITEPSTTLNSLYVLLVFSLPSFAMSLDVITD